MFTIAVYIVYIDVCTVEFMFHSKKLMNYSRRLLNEKVSRFLLMRSNEIMDTIKKKTVFF